MRKAVITRAARFTRYHRNASWKAIRNYSSLVKEIDTLDKAVTNARLKYESMVQKLSDLQLKIESEEQFLIGKDEFLVTSDKDVNTVIHITEKHPSLRDKLLVKAVCTSKISKMKKMLRKEKIKYEILK